MFENQKESEFNSGLAIIYQLDGIEKAMVEATLESNYILHYKLLFVYFKTLFSHLTPTEQTEQLERWRQIKINKGIIMSALENKQKTISTDILESFDCWELELRNLKQKHGLGMPEKDARYVGKKR